MAWGGMTARGLTALHFIPNGIRHNVDYYIANIGGKAGTVDRLSQSIVCNKKIIMMNVAFVVSVLEPFSIGLSLLKNCQKKIHPEKNRQF